MGKSLLLQIINGYVSTSAFIAMIIFLRYIYRNFALGYEELRAAIVFLVLCFGTVALRLPIFYARTLINAGYEVSEPTWAYIVGGLLLEAAFLCTIRVFAPAAWSKLAVVGTFVTSTLLVVSSVLFVIWSQS